MMAESGGDERQITTDEDDYSYGLWQINMKGSMGPTRRALYGLSSNDELLDPATNARVMSDISKQGANFNAWGAFTNGSYRKFLVNTVAVVDVPHIPLPGVSGLIANGLGFLAGTAPSVNTSLDVISTLSTIGNGVRKTGAWVSNPRNWVRVAYVGGGIILIYASIQSFVIPMVAKTAGKVAGVVGPGGKVSKVAGAAKKIGEKASTS
jgi:hypothetical protein